MLYPFRLQFWDGVKTTADRSNGIVSRLGGSGHLPPFFRPGSWPSIEWPIQLTTHAAARVFHRAAQIAPIHTCMKLCEEPFLGQRPNPFRSTDLSVERFFGSLYCESLIFAQLIKFHPREASLIISGKSHTDVSLWGPVSHTGSTARFVRRE